tara:strand:+ start:91 stop:237 length:147 start_codon:yes stop_codon:yes gene_type:complete
MKKKYLIYILWLILVILWNFIFPNVKPIYDVLTAVILSAFSSQMTEII